MEENKGFLHGNFDREREKLALFNLHYYSVCCFLGQTPSLLEGVFSEEIYTRAFSLNMYEKFSFYDKRDGWLTGEMGG